jgi:aerobic carbon-monoxide dehydrogenase large subunit
LGEFDPATGRYTLTAGTQGGHAVRDIVAPILGISPADLRVVTPDVGGGFGTKSFVYHEYPLVLWAARTLNRPVSWQQERTEHFLSCAHGRDNVVTLSLAFDADAKITAMKVDLVANMGAYLNQYAPFIPYVGVTMTTGLYDIPVLDVKVRGVYTHTVPVDAYRGAGRPEAAYHLERLMDYAADQLGLDRAELRPAQFHPPRPASLPHSDRPAL